MVRDRDFTEYVSARTTTLVRSARLLRCSDAEAERPGADDADALPRGMGQGCSRRRSATRTCIAFC